jgi:hypothetical protein
VNRALRSSDSRKSRHLACYALFRTWVVNDRFGSPLWYKQQGRKLLTLLFISSVRLNRNRLSPPLILRLALLCCPRWLVRVTTVDAPAAGVPTAITTHRRPVAQGRAPPLVRHRHQPGESSTYADACLGLLLHRDTDFCSLIGAGPRLLRMR